MVKKIFLITFLLLTTLYSSDFDGKCLNCHKNKFQFQMFMKKYTMKHSSERRIKNAIYEYLKNPTYSTSLLPFGFLQRFGVKEKTNLNDKDLRDMIDIYYERYNLKSKIY